MLYAFIRTHVPRAAATALALTSVLSCGGPNHPYGAGSSENMPPSSTPTYTLANASTQVQAGVQAGYGIRSLGGNTYRILWTGDGNVGGGYHEFWGTMWTTGQFTNLVPGCTNNFCALEAGDYVSTAYSDSTGQRIDWDTFASDGLDGLEFTADTQPVYFDVYIDGNRLPDLVFFPDATNGGTIANVTAIPFAMNTH